MPEALLLLLDNKRDASAQRFEIPGVLLKRRRQAVIVLRRKGRTKVGLEQGPVLRLNDKGHLLDAGTKRFLDDDLDDRLGQAVAVHDGGEFLLHGFRRRKHARAETGGGNDRLADALGWGYVERQTRDVEVALEDTCGAVAGFGIAGYELGTAVALAAHTFAAPD